MIEADRAQIRLAKRNQSLWGGYQPIGVNGVSHLIGAMGTNGAKAVNGIGQPSEYDKF